MGIGTGTAAIIGGVATAAGGIGSAVIGGNAAQSAASDQSQAAQQAAQLQYQASQNALGFQENEFNTQQAELQPWLQSGTGALGNLDYLLGVNPQTAAQFGTGNQGQMAPINNQPPQFGSNGLAMVNGAPPPTSYQANASNPYGLNPGGLNSPQGGTTQNLTASLNGANPSQGLARVNPSSPGQNGPLTPNSTPLTPTQPGTPAFNTAGLPSVGNRTPGQPVAESRTTPTPGLPEGSGASLNPGQLPGAGTPGVTSLGQGAPAGSSIGQPSGMGQPAGQGASPGGYGSLLSPYPGQFTAPTAQQALQSPAEQAQLALGEQALQQSAAAQGNLLTGGVAQGLNSYAQNVAAQNYQNVYNNAYNTYGANYNQYEQQQANEYNRLASLAGVGQTAAGQLGTLGQNASNNITGNLLGTAGSIGGSLQNAAEANASGIVGSANAYGGALSGAGNNLSNLLLMQSLGGSGGAQLSNADWGDITQGAGVQAQ